MMPGPGLPAPRAGGPSKTSSTVPPGGTIARSRPRSVVAGSDVPERGSAPSRLLTSTMSRRTPVSGSPPEGTRCGGCWGTDTSQVSHLERASAVPAGRPPCGPPAVGRPGRGSPRPWVAPAVAPPGGPAATLWYMLLLVDLDGVVYRGAAPVPGVASVLAACAAAGDRVVYVTNNSMHYRADYVA